MVNSQVISEIVDALKLDSRVDTIPNPVPVVEVGVKSVINSRIASVTGAATSNTILAANANNDIYILGAAVSIIKNATNTSTGTAIIIIDEYGITRSILKIISLTLTAQAEATSITFNHPIKIKRNTSITLTHDAADASISGAASIFYYVDEIS